ncbi:hypothetical protein J2X36_000773 [Methylobacterium sp. BE186]|nr:hypothetical protein [Methylobacterium sp. BE186]MDR7036037.1 hypothetical protein [Methylobacterium sp. BE186]
MTVLRTLDTHLDTEAGLTQLFAFMYSIIAAECAVIAYGLLAH